MNINRDNYETYFLLYIDNELSVAERKAVEEFVAQHTDLQEELDQLQDVILSPDEISVFAEKSSLLKSSLLQDSIEENMLLLLDDELDSKETKAMEHMIASDELLKKDWEILQRTKSDAADTIVFADKHLLYRKERDNVVVGRFLRWAVAAILIGAGFFATIAIINNKNTPSESIAGMKNDTNDHQAVKTKASNGKQKIVADPSAIVTEDSNNTGTQQQQLAKEEEDKVKEKHQQRQLVQTLKKTTIDVSVPEIKKDHQEENPVLAANHPNVSIEKIGPEKTRQEMAINTLQQKPDLRDINMLEILKNGMASTASLTEETNDDRILYMNEEDVSRSKAGGFFRKIKRTIARKANIKTGNGLKIAGFEIAVK